MSSRVLIRRVLIRLVRFYHDNVCTVAMIVAVVAAVIVIQAVWG
jgi:hypothetical protein